MERDTQNIAALTQADIGKSTAAAISRIKLNAHTFLAENIYPTYINFFFGKNGTGKTTIAKIIAGTIDKVDPSAETLPPRQNTALELDNRISGDCEILLYDKSFIDTHFANYGSIKGVYTIGKENTKINAQIDEKSKLLPALEGKISTIEKKLSQAKDKARIEWDNYINKVWENTKAFRNEVKKIHSFANISTKEKLASTLVGYKGGKLLVVVHDENRILANLAELAVAYAKEMPRIAHAAIWSDTADFYKRNPVLTDEEHKELVALLQKPIKTSGDTDFARFMRALGSADWVRHGFTQFHKSPNRNGKCPYCQGKLREDFEEQIKQAFDAEYENDIAALKNLTHRFELEANVVYEHFIQQYETIKSHLTDKRDQYFKDELLKINKIYGDCLKQLGVVVESNQMTFAAKLSSPSEPVNIIAITDTVEKLNEQIEAFNRLADNQNVALDNRKKAQNDAYASLIRNLAGQVQNEINDYLAFKKESDAIIAAATAEIKKVNTEKTALEAEIKDLSENTVNMTDAVDNINKALRTTGFQGFHLYAKDPKKGICQVVRDKADSKGGNNIVVAENLSEGERHFVAFLYFCQLVRGSLNKGSTQKSKIIVIDDPVSSLDSSSLLVISDLVRGMCRVCQNNVEEEQLRALSRSGAAANLPNYIKQIFVLTHNPYFYRQITGSLMQKYEYVSLFNLTKNENISAVEPKIKKRTEGSSEKYYNISPVKNNYALLWSEFAKTKDGAVLITTGRGILAQYFLDICSYSATEILDAAEYIQNKELEEHDPDTIDLAGNLAKALLLNIGGERSLDDDFYYNPADVDLNACRNVFRDVFVQLGHGRHYDKMIEDAQASA